MSRRLDGVEGFATNSLNTKQEPIGNDETIFVLIARAASKLPRKPELRNMIIAYLYSF